MVSNVGTLMFTTFLKGSSSLLRLWALASRDEFPACESDAFRVLGKDCSSSCDTVFLTNVSTHYFIFEGFYSEKKVVNG